MTLKPAPFPGRVRCAPAARGKDSPWRLTVAIRWNPSRGATLGIEWELQLIDCRSRMLRQDAREVLAALPALSEVGENPKIRYELMQSAGEGVTGICTTVSEAKEDLTATIAQLERITGSCGQIVTLRGTRPRS